MLDSLQSNDKSNEKKKKSKQDLSSTFVDNMSLPIHRWFRYSAGFSAQWVEGTIEKSLIKKNIKNRSEFVVFDPFAGSGTTLLAGETIGVQAYGFESHPLVSVIARTKLLWRTNVTSFEKFSEHIIKEAMQLEGSSEGYADLIYKCYSEEVICKLDSIKKTIAKYNNDTPEYYLTWLAFVAILRNSSHAGTAQWQYVLPNKTKVFVSEPFVAFKRQVDLMIQDMIIMQQYIDSPRAQLYDVDSRTENKLLTNSVDLIITSPPYANNYDYADATRLELSFLGKIGGWSDLQSTVRRYLVRSCTQHVGADVKGTFDYLHDDLLLPIYDEILDVCTQLEAEREFHGGKKNYHTMIALYFLDLAKVWINLRRICKEGSDVCFVIGDSAPYGIYVPVDKWIGELAISAGFHGYEFEKTRDRNIKWENRKHRVPLKEGRLWVKG